MTETVRNDNKLKNFFIRTLADPVLIYVSILVSSVMYHYRDSLALTYGVLAYIIGWVLFRLFDFMKKHKIIGTVLYIIVGIGFLYALDAALQKGKENYPIDPMLWFITPQDSLQYNKWYTLGIFIFSVMFASSVFYFFTRVQYRVFMTFLIMIIPFTIYGKEYEEMPIGYIIALTVGYIIILMYFRQLTDNKNVVVIDKSESWKSGVVFVAIFAVIASLIPKPQIEADRTILETLINADAFTDRLVAMLNVFRDTTSGEQFRTQNNDTPLYYAHSPQDLRLKTSTYSTYNYNNDSWSIGSTDDQCYTMTGKPFDIVMNGELCDALFYVAGLDSSFAETYGLTDYVGYEPVYPEKQEMSIFSSYQDGTRTPVPQNVSELLETSYQSDMLVSRAGAVISISSDKKFKYNESFKYSYIPDGFFENTKNKSAVDMLGKIEEYSEMLHSASDILESSDYDSEKISHYRDIIKVNLLYDSFRYELLDYGDNEKIYNLAQEITAGLDSDYDKAKALEWYFIDNNYTYDLNYRKEIGENAEDFLFRTKKGVCYEYATAMTLLARACGIPARFCEGFNMNTKYPNSRDKDLYVITPKDAHGFPELYIKGFGWVTFEPTMTWNNINQETNDRNASGMLSKAGLWILVLCISALLLIISYPVLAHKFFSLINNRKRPNEAVAGVVHRICRLYKIPVSCTAREAEKTVKRVSGADISTVATLFERAEYGGAELSEEDKTKAMEEYISAYEALRESIKEKRRQKHKK